MDILHVIDYWLAGPQHRIKFKTIAIKIHIPCNTLLHITIYEDQKRLPNFVDP